MKKLFSLFLILALLLSGCYVEYAPPVTEPVHTETFDSTATTADTLMVHFIDVGQADCALIEWGGFYILIDGGNKEDGQLVVSYLEQQNVETLNAVVCTHAHEDHVGGLPSVLAVYPTERVYAPTKTYSSNIFDDFVYYTDQQDLEVTIPSPGDSFTFNDGESEIKFTVLGPTESYAETNDTSIILKLEYGETSFLFTGDMETAAENDMLDYWGDNVDWNVDVLKVGHHGSNTSSGYRFVYETDPEYAIISCGKDNSYGHPHEEVVSRYQDAGVPMLRTDLLGTIYASSDGRNVTITWANQDAAPEDLAPAETAGISYIGNRNSQKLHTPDCRNLPKEENQVVFGSYEEAIEAGYEPCGSCIG